MPQLIFHPRSMTVVVALSLAVFTSTASARPLVNCKDPRFKPTASARSLWSWSLNAEKQITKQIKSGLPTTRSCKNYISKMGAAHCLELTNSTYSDLLLRLQTLCDAAKAPPKSTKGTLVDCTDKRFDFPKVSTALLIKWSKMGLGSVKGARAHESFRIKPYCEKALNHAGAAHCKAPDGPEGRAAVKEVQETCAAARAKDGSDKAKAKQDEIDAVAKAKADRKIVKFPRPSYRGARAKALSKAMKRALLTAKLAKSPAEVIKIQPTGSWQTGKYRGTRVPFKKVTGIVLWWDKDSDGVCRYVSYNFIKDRKGRKWSPLRVKSFCMGCPEGWVRCK